MKEIWFGLDEFPLLINKGNEREEKIVKILGLSLTHILMINSEFEPVHLHLPPSYYAYAIQYRDCGVPYISYFYSDKEKGNHFCKWSLKIVGTRLLSRSPTTGWIYTEVRIVRKIRMLKCFRKIQFPCF